MSYYLYSSFIESSGAIANSLPSLEHWLNVRVVLPSLGRQMISLIFFTGTEDFGRKPWTIVRCVFTYMYMCVCVCVCVCVYLELLEGTDVRVGVVQSHHVAARDEWRVSILEVVQERPSVGPAILREKESEHKVNSVLINTRTQ